MASASNVGKDGEEPPRSLDLSSFRCLPKGISHHQQPTQVPGIEQGTYVRGIGKSVNADILSYHGSDRSRPSATNQRKGRAGE
jgi:hypothetical protein